MILCADHKDNVEFHKLFHDKRVGDYGRAELRIHIQKPFYLIDRIKEGGTEWDFQQDNNISVFTYMSLLGAGSFVPFVVLALQVAIPVVLVIKVIGTDCGDSEDSGDKPDSLGQVMALIVYVLYFFTVIPNTFMRFYEVEGGADTVYSRLLSLRRELWVQGDDSITQMIGFKLDIFMSTAYECALSMLNIAVIRSTYDTMEIILNALAFTFIALIDQEIVKSAWWDPKNRWLVPYLVCYDLTLSHTITSHYQKYYECLLIIVFH